MGGLAEAGEGSLGPCVNISLLVVYLDLSDYKSMKVKLGLMQVKGKTLVLVIAFLT